MTAFKKNTYRARLVVQSDTCGLFKEKGLLILIYYNNNKNVFNLFLKGTVANVLADCWPF